jgi:hypothetical protein
MKPNNSNMLVIFILFLLVISILCVIRLIIVIPKVSNNSSNSIETFKSNKFKDVVGKDLMKQRNERARYEEVLNSINNTIDKGNEENNRLVFENAGANNELMTKYINDIMLSDVGNPNKILVEDSHNELPSVIENNLPQYNHEMRKLQNSKQIKQSYIIKILKYKIETLLNSLKNIEEIKDEMKIEKNNKKPIPLMKRDLDMARR